MMLMMTYFEPDNGRNFAGLREISLMARSRKEYRYIQLTDRHVWCVF